MDERSQVGTTSQDPKLMDMYVIYDNPSDAPGKFVVRRWEIYTATETSSGCVPKEATEHATIEEARSAVPAGLVRLDREPGDEPHIVENWL